MACRARQKILEECGGDLEKLLDRLKAAEAQDRSRLLSLKSYREHVERERSRPEG